MLPFSLKLAFFVLSILGTLCSGVVLVAFGQAINVTWLPYSYGLANLVLQLTFCLGMIWKMDPYQMPHWFCVTQTVFIALGAFLLTGVCTSFAVATATAVFRPSSIRDFSTLRWRKINYLFMIVFPALASAAQIVTIIKLDAVKPTDDMHCDATNPIWARFLGYAGVSWLLCVPSFFITSFAAWRLFQTPRLFLSSAHNSDQSSTFPNITFRSNPGTEAEIVLDPRKSFDLKSPGIVTTPNTAHSLLYKGRMSSSTTQEESRYHIPFNLTPNASDRGCSPSIPEFAPISNSRSVPNPGGSSTFLTPGPLDDTDPYHSRYVPQKRRDGSQTDVEYETAGSLGWIAAADYSPRLSMDSVLSKLDDLDPDYVEQVDKKVPPQCAKPVRMESYGAKHTSQPLSQGHSRATSSSNRQTNFGPAIWRLLLFQISFFLIECFAALSTVIDVARGSKVPMPFGTQHVALIFAAWGPFIVFSHLPAVKKQILGWFRQ